ncbi:MAG: MOSC domain-containing protein [Phycisphaeraceae bacterium]
MQTIGKIIALALRPARSIDMIEVSEARATAGGALEGDHGKGGRRGITLLSAVQWADVISRLGFDLPWHARRANVLVDALTLAPLVGKTITVGALRVKIHNITQPCSHIDELHPGLFRALAGEGRGGVYGEILNEGVVRVGDGVAEEG